MQEEEEFFLKGLNPAQLEHKKKLMRMLRKHLPDRMVGYCSELIMLHKLHLHIESERKDRLGDYSPHMGFGNRISINHNLNKFDFLITFMHELAHHTAYKKFGPRHQSHGPEWKSEFKAHMRRPVMMGIFPPDIEVPLIAHMKAPSATHSGDIKLMKALMQYNSEQHLILDQLPQDHFFKLTNRSKKIFHKGPLRKTYYVCVEFHTGKMYLVHGITKVIPVPDPPMMKYDKDASEPNR